MAFSFGLLHGFGFAGALTEIGLPQGDIPLALFAFNIGVEVGQLIFIAAVLGAVGSRQTVQAAADRRTPRAFRFDLCDWSLGRVLVHRAPGRISNLRPYQGARTG